MYGCNVSEDTDDKNTNCVSESTESNESFVDINVVNVTDVEKIAHASVIGKYKLNYLINYHFDF